jgi:hypothetical protein
MKKSLFSMILGLSVVFGFGQYNHKPPKEVSESFQREYPKSKPSKWSQSNEGWNVSFQDIDHNNGESTAYFDASGKHVDTHIPYDHHDVPVSVRNHTRDNYGASDQYDYTRIDRSGEKAVYKTQVKHQKHNKTIYMDNDGHERNFHDEHYQ